METLRLRVQLTKQGMMRYLSHAEYSRLLMMAARRSGLPLHFTEGYRPRLKISLSPPLPIGTTSECELVDFFLEEYVSPVEAANALAASLPAGIKVVRCRLVGRGARSVGRLIDAASYEAVLPGEAGNKGAWDDAVETFMKKELIEIERVQPRRTRVVDLRPGVHRLQAQRESPESLLSLEMVVDDGIRGTVKPREVLQVLAGYAGVPPEQCENARINRKGLFARRGDRLVSPMDLGKSKPAV